MFGRPLLTPPRWRAAQPRFCQFCRLLVVPHDWAPIRQGYVVLTRRVRPGPTISNDYLATTLVITPWWRRRSSPLRGLASSFALPRLTSPSLPRSALRPCPCRRPVCTLVRLD